MLFFLQVNLLDETSSWHQDHFAFNRSSSQVVVEGLYLKLCEHRVRISLPSPSPDFNQQPWWKQWLITDQSLSEVTISIWVQVDSSSLPAPTLLPRGPACGWCNILIGWFVWRGRGRGRVPEYCDLTISCFVRSTFWSEDQLEAAINRRKICSGKHREEEEKAADVMIWNISVTFLHKALLLRRKPFIFISWCFNYLT